MNYAQTQLATFTAPPSTQTEQTTETVKNIPKNKEKVTSILDPRLEIIKEKLHVAPSLSSSGLLQFIDQGNPEKRGRYFGGKNILDLGGGFGGIPWLLEFYAKKITIVDPIFSENDEMQLLDADLFFISERIQFIQERLKKPNVDTFIQRLLKKNEEEYEKILSETKLWENYNPKKHKNIVRNSSFGENLEGIADSSQDVIFLNHIITKDTVQIPELFAEIERVLAPNGKIFISNVNDDDERRIINQVLGYIAKKWDIQFLEEDKFFVAELQR